MIHPSESKYPCTNCCLLSTSIFLAQSGIDFPKAYFLKWLFKKYDNCLQLKDISTQLFLTLLLADLLNNWFISLYNLFVISSSLMLQEIVILFFFESTQPSPKNNPTNHQNSEE